MSVEAPSHTLPRCAVHPDMPAGGTCSRCGSFVCTTCATWMTERLFCATCAARPELNYLETFRLTLWGRRDAWVYLVAAVTGTLAVGGLSAVLSREWVIALALFVPVPVGVGFVLGRPWARPALVAAPVASGAVLSVHIGGGALLLSLIPAVMGLRIIADVRNQLFFRRTVSMLALHRLWDLRVNNPIARHALQFGLSSLFVPLFAPIAIVCGIVGLLRVDSKAQPPIGRGWQAVAGIVLPLLSLYLWAQVILPLFVRMMARQD
jgi:hypothetical protein